MDVEILVIGAGVFGLSIARTLKQRGREVLVVDAAEPGSGASATPLGVLAPHSPDRWNEKKQAQFEALTSLADVAAELSAETGIDVGYRRCGRLIPLTRDHHPQMWRGRRGEAVTNWQGLAALSLVAPDPAWVAPESAPFGAVHCTLTARIDARAYCAALAQAVSGEAIITGLSLTQLEARSGLFECGERINAQQIILANGADAFRFWPEPTSGTPAGRGEKGQAAILKLPSDQHAVADRSLIYSDRLYIVPHESGTVAVGATSEREFDDPSNTDEQLDALIERARRVSPALANADVVEKWARLRPRAADKRLLVERHPSIVGLMIATGGFKTGLAMAHTVGNQVAGMVTDA